MSAVTANNQFAFELPNLTYVDTRLEDPVLPPIADFERPHGLRAWLAAFHAWREKQAALAELELMSDRELADIGLNRCDVPRVFNDNFNQDLRSRSVA